MRRHGLAVLLLLIAIAASGCTDSTEPAATSSTSGLPSANSTAGESSESVDPSSSSETDGGDTALTQAEAQAALDDALAAVDKEGSIGFTSRGENVLNGEVTKISGSGAWTRKPLAWTTTTTIDRPKVIIDSVSVDVEIIDQIYVESTPSGPYVRTTHPDLKKAGLVYPPEGWIKGFPAYRVGDGSPRRTSSPHRTSGSWSRPKPPPAPSSATP